MSTSIAPEPRRRRPDRTERHDATVNGRAIPRPFMKWAGGKTMLLRSLLRFVPERPRCYYEPFVGGGALFFHLGPGRAVLADTNAELMHAFTVVRDRVDELVEVLSAHVHDKDHFYRVRSLDPAALGEVERAARTIYLNRTCFNGMYRVNKKGRFNVPFGRYDNPRICDEDNLRACSGFLRQAELSTSDFEAAVQDARRGDFVYLDPPYVPVARFANFTEYRPGGFAWRDHERLVRVFEELARRGVAVVLSNSSAQGVRELYEGMRVKKTIEVVRAPRSVNSKVRRRGDVRELLVAANCG